LRTLGLEDTEDLVTGDETDLRDSVRVTESDTDLGRGETLAGKFDDVFDDIIGCSFEPGGRCSSVRKGRGRYIIKP
jgi:hypothetical protein